MFVVNVEVFLRRGDRCLLIERGAALTNAAGLLCGVGGKAEAFDGDPGSDSHDLLRRTARREVAEEVGIDLCGVDLTYVDSTFFTADDGDPVINVVFSGELPPGIEPRAASPREVAGVHWVTAAEAASRPNCPPWTIRSLARVFGSRTTG